MELYHIVAVSGDQRIIGKDNQLPWPKISEDLKFFKATTDGSTVIMGRHTFESIGKKPLPGRENIVLTHSDLPVPPGVKTARSFGDALRSASKPKVFIIGGAQIYAQTIERVDGIYLTRIPTAYPGDVSYPAIPDWFKEESREPLPGNPEIEVIFYKNTKK